jgi:hypothetical protein
MRTLQICLEPIDSVVGSVKKLIENKGVSIDSPYFLLILNKWILDGHEHDVKLDVGGDRSRKT